MQVFPWVTKTAIGWCHQFEAIERSIEPPPQAVVPVTIAASGGRR